MTKVLCGVVDTLAVYFILIPCLFVALTVMRWEHKRSQRR
jgi:hypothetical protein